MLGPLVVFAAAVLAARIVEGTWPDLSRFGTSTEYPALPLAVYWVANLLCCGYGEEIGWRGFAQPALQRGHSALSAALFVLTWLYLRSRGSILVVASLAKARCADLDEPAVSP